VRLKLVAISNVFASIAVMLCPHIQAVEASVAVQGATTLNTIHAYITIESTIKTIPSKLIDEPLTNWVGTATIEVPQEDLLPTDMELKAGSYKDLSGNPEKPAAASVPMVTFDVTAEIAT